MELILCNTNLCVTTVISLILSQRDKQYIVLTDQHNIEKFFRFLALNNVILKYVESYYSFFSFKLYKSKKAIRDLLINNDVDKVRIFHQAFGGFFNWIAHTAYRNGIPVEYNRVLIDQKYPKAKISYNVIKEKYRYAILYRTDVDILDRGNNTLMPKLSHAFYSKNNIKETSVEIDDNIVKNISELILKKLGYRIDRSAIVLLTGSVIATDQVCVDDYTNKTKELINVIGVNNLICKCHPRFSDEIEDEINLPHIPSFIPMEFFVQYFNTFIGYNSTILNLVAELNKTAVSLVDYYIPRNEERRNNWHNYLSDGVLFPKSIDEIRNILQ